jgi:phospholipase/lecithinase/hemolysin
MLEENRPEKLSRVAARKGDVRIASNQYLVNVRQRPRPALDSCLPRGNMVAEIGRAANKDPTGGDVQMTHRSLSRAVLTLCACSAALFAVSAARAANFSAEYVFGDSLSDNGNLAGLVGAFPNPPSFDNSFTNGPVAVQLLAQSLGLSANASLWLTSPSPQGTNYAVGGATAAAGTDIVPGVNINLPSQVAAFSASVSDHADPNALYVIMIGGNDVIDAVLGGSGPSAVTAGANQEVTEISTLADEGAKHFLIVDVPNVGQIPLFTQEAPPPAAAEATAFSQLYDTDLSAGLAGLDLGAGATLTDFDLFGFNANILANAAAHGFTNTTDPCYSFTALPTSAASNTGCSPANVDTFLFFNDVHPTAPVQALWADGLRSAIPEPSTWAMLLVGFVGLGFAGYRRSARARATA